MASFVTYEYLFKNGRLGNQLWQIASTAGIADACGSEPRFPKWEYEKYFNVPSRFFVENLPVNSRDLGTDYLQELHYFDNIASQVKEWFEPSFQVQDELEARYPWFFDGSHHTAIHVRRGDYVGLPNHFPTPTFDYYTRASDIVLETSPHTTFVVFSDDIAWCEEQFSGQVQFVRGVPRPVEVVERVGAPEDQYDLFLMALCDKFIISNSTFSWWGAYLSDSPDVFYPRTWFGPALDNQQCPAPDSWRSLESC